MFNLLPPEQKKRARLEYHARLGAVAMYLFAAALLLGATMLIPSYVAATLRIEAAEAAREALQSAERDEENPAAIVAGIRRNVAILEALAQPVSVESLIERALAQRPLGVTVAAIAFQNGTAGSATVSLKGTARTRSSLVAFVRALEGEPLFSKVELPISNLAKNEDIPFTMTVPVTRTPPSEAVSTP